MARITKNIIPFSLETKKVKPKEDFSYFDYEDLDTDFEDDTQPEENIKPEKTNVDESEQDKYLELLLCPPKYLSTKVKNNKWMKDMDQEKLDVNIDKAMAQFFHMYSLFSQDAMVYLLPPKKGLQDQVYIVNAGVVLPHLGKTVVLSNFTAKGRDGEEDQLSEFMTLMGYKQVFCPYKFEGEAELKWIRENHYIGGYGIRTEIEAHEWLESEFDAHIIKIKESDPLRYHLDCLLFSISKSKILLAIDQVDGKTMSEIEKIAEIIPVSKQDSQYAITNNLRIGSIIYTLTDIQDLKKDDENYIPEKEKNERLEEICRDAGLELVFINLSEFRKSGAALSCCILHLSQIAYPD